MDPKITCFYCLYWKSSKTAYLNKNNDKTIKKKRGKRKKELIEKTCKVNDRGITSETICCKYFKPASFFYCYQRNCWLKFEQCLNSVKQKKHYFNGKGIKKYLYPECLNCYQFAKEVEPMCELFKIKSPKKREIVRRKKIRKKIRIISRRIKPQRKIKRRQKKRIIKRR